MATVEWHDDALTDLISHDGWCVEATFAKGIFPWRRARIKGELSPVYRARIVVRSKPFLVYFMGATTGPVIRRILHHRRNVAYLRTQL